MDFEAVVAFCRTLPGTTEDVKWGDHLCFLVGGKIYAILSLAPGALPVITLKAGPAGFETLTAIPGVVPAPYLARGGWVALERWGALDEAPLKSALRVSYELVRAGLPKRVREELVAAPARRAPGRPRRRR